MTPALVSLAIMVGDWERFGDAAAGSSCRTLARPKSSDLDGALGRNLDVGRFEIPVDDVSLVSGFQSFGNLKRDPKIFFKRHGAAGDPFRERFAVDILQHESQTAAGFLHSMDRRNVRVIQSRQHLRLAREARQAFGIALNRFGKNLQRHVAAQLCIARAIHLSHSARTERKENLIRTDV
jgi:hypothetical protein